MKVFIMIIILCLGGYAQADGGEDINLYMGAWSKHLITNDDYTSSHDLVGIQYGQYFAGRFRNSYGRTSYALAHGVFKHKVGDWEGQVLIGVVRGYRRCFSDDGDKAVVCPLVVPMVSYTKYAVQPTLLLMGEALALSVRVEF